jgi:hypothetical protein
MGMIAMLRRTNGLLPSFKVDKPTAKETDLMNVKTKSEAESRKGELKPEV